MQGAFAIVLFVVVGIGVVAAIAALVTSGDSYRQIGRGGMSIGGDRPLRPPESASPPAPLTPGQQAEREAEVRQMLEARNVRRTARGEAAGDVEEELRELLRPAADPGLEAEVRELVIARNNRRVARGRPPLDVEEEVARRLRELG